MWSELHFVFSRGFHIGLSQRHPFALPPRARARGRADSNEL